MEEMTSPRAVDAAARGFQEEAADLECRLRAADEARAAVEGRLRERDAECQGLRDDLAGAAARQGASLKS